MRTTIVLLTVALAALQSPEPYRIVQTFPLGGDGGWDYIVPDPASHRLFVGRANRVMVVDEQTGTLVGTVTGIDGAHGTAIAGATGHGFATSGNDGTVVMFDLKSLKALKKIPAAEDADAIIYDAARTAFLPSMAMRIHRPSSILRRARPSATSRSTASRNTARRPATARSTRT